MLNNAQKNLKVTTHDNQKEIANAITETTNAIILDLGNDLFSILVDGSRDVAVKEQIIILLCFVNKEGSVIE